MEILKDDHPILLTPCTDVKKHIIPHIHHLIHDMYETLYNSNGIGLAANQVGYNINLFIMDITKDRKNQHVFINPIILEFSEEKVIKEEGCLSYPDHYKQKERSKSIFITYLDRFGKQQAQRFKQTEAIVIQHEIDHLLGKSFLGE